MWSVHGGRGAAAGGHRRRRPVAACLRQDAVRHSQCSRSGRNSGRAQEVQAAREADDGTEQTGDIPAAATGEANEAPKEMKIAKAKKKRKGGRARRQAPRCSASTTRRKTAVTCRCRRKWRIHHWRPCTQGKRRRNRERHPAPPECTEAESLQAYGSLLSAMVVDTCQFTNRQRTRMALRLTTTT